MFIKLIKQIIPSPNLNVSFDRNEINAKLGINLPDDYYDLVAIYGAGTFANFIKTSTGFGTRGASLEDISIINKHKNEILEVKASGGIKTYEDASKFIESGVTRIGTSNGVSMMQVSKEEK